MIFEAAHQIALLPILALIIVLFRGGTPNIGQMLLAASFFISWIADSLTTYYDNWGSEYVYIWMPIQVVLAYLASRHGGLYIPILIYFGLGTVAFVLFLNGQYGPNVMGFWLLYQACRLSGIAALCFLILRPQEEQAHVVCN